jgi:hypothetical protein
VEAEPMSKATEAMDAFDTAALKSQKRYEETGESTCHVSIDFEALKTIRITDSQVITINGREARNKGGWTLGDIIDCAAWQPRPNHSGSEGYGYAAWHSHVFLESFEQDGLNFTLEFGS